MSTETTTPAPVAPVATDPPVVQPIVASATTTQVAPTPVTTPAAAPSGTEVKLTSDALKQRLADAQAAEQRRILGKAGVEKIEDLEAKLKKLADLELAQLSEKERTEKQIAELAKQADGAKGLGAVAADAVGELFAALPEGAQAAIEELQPATPAERLKLIRAFRKVAATTPAPATPASAPASAPAAPLHAAPPAAPVTTTPAPNAPRPGGKTKYQEYQDLKAQNHPSATLFYNANKRAIEATRPVVPLV